MGAILSSESKNYPKAHLLYLKMLHGYLKNIFPETLVEISGDYIYISKSDILICKIEAINFRYIKIYRIQRPTKTIYFNNYARDQKLASMAKEENITFVEYDIIAKLKVQHKLDIEAILNKMPVKFIYNTGYYYYHKFSIVDKFGNRMLLFQEKDRSMKWYTGGASIVHEKLISYKYEFFPFWKEFADSNVPYMLYLNVIAIKYSEDLFSSKSDIGSYIMSIILLLNEL